jgi:GNAT superfamily N-acetyltransferase
MADLVRLTAPDIHAQLPALVTLLEDAVNHGASVGFLRPLEPALAEAYWRDVAEAVGAGSRMLLAAREAGEVVGSVQLDLSLKQNGRHRAEVQKLLVLARCRRRGIARDLMQAIEAQAKQAGRTLLVLDTESGSDAVPFYDSQGWQRCGSIPDFALSADGVPTANILYFKRV